MYRVVYAIGLFVLLFVSALFPAFLIAREPSPLDADERVCSSPFLPDGAAWPPAAGQPPQVQPPLVVQPPQMVEPSQMVVPRAADAQIPWSRVVYYALDLNNWDIYISDDDGENAARLTQGKAIEVEPDLNRGGTHIVYTSDVDGDFDLHIMRLSDRATVRLLDTPADEYTPVWSPDGSRIAFQSDRDGQPEIYVVDSNGGNLKRLTTNPDFDGYPSWSPDGARLAFSSRRNGQYRVWVMNADGSGQTQLSQQPGGLHPVWSPDGGEIAYSADSNGDGWLDLWRMSADGKNQRAVLIIGDGHDLLARSWSPDGRMLAYTYVAYIVYQGQLYINLTYIERIELDSSYRYILGTSAEYPFGPAWQTLDNQAPVSSISALPPVSPGPIALQWSVADRGPAGIRKYVIQVKTGGGPWVDWAVNPSGTQAQFEAIGGETYAFRGRAIDLAHNVEPWPAAPEATTTVEALPPVTSLAPLPAFSRADQSFRLTRGGFDPGQSGIVGFLLQWRRNDGAWANWPEAWMDDQTTFDPAARGLRPGNTAAFRLSGTDAAHNVEPWSPDPDAMTTFYSWGAAGRVLDNTGTPVGGATVTADPAMFGEPLSGPDGEFARYLGTDGVPTTLDWAKPGYGGLPATLFTPAADVTLDVVLPPVDDVAAGGDFEAADWGEWAVGGTLTPTLSAEARHTGARGALLAPRPATFGQVEKLTTNLATQEPNARISTHDGVTTVVWARGGYPATLKAVYRAPNGEWSLPIDLISGVYADYVMTTGDDGRIHIVAWSSSNLFYIRQTGDTTWAAAETIPGSAQGFDPALAAGPDGVLHVIWTTNNSATFSLQYSRRATNGAWSAPFGVVVMEQAFIEIAGVTRTPDGALHLVYEETNFAQAIERRLWVQERRSDGNWNAPRLLQQTDGTIWSVRPPVSDAAGRVHLVWGLKIDTQSGWLDLIYHAVKDGPVWGSPRMIYQPGWGGYVHAVDLGPDGAVHVLISENITDLTHLALPPGGAWLPPEPVPGEIQGFHRMLVDNAGQPHVVHGGWDITAYIPRIEYTRRLPDGAWSAVVSPPADYAYQFQPDLALDSGGNVHLVWMARGQEWSQTQSDILYVGPIPGDAGEVALTQTVTIPDVAHPALSFFYGFGGGATNATRLEVVIGEEAPRSLPSALGDGASRHHWLDLADYAGQTVDVSFRLVQAAGEPAAWAAIDDVSLGAAVADVWVAGASGSALPGETVIIELIAGNRGGVAAEGVELTLALPPELAFSGADPAPDDATGPLRWSLGTLSPGRTRTIRVTATVKSSAEPFSSVTAVAGVAFPGELETHNNAAGIITRLERTIYLPASSR